MKHFLGVCMAAALAGCGGASSKQSEPSGAAASPPVAVASGAAPVEPLPAVIPDPLDRSKSLEGPDKDNNGVRDDVDAWINAQTLTEPQKAAVVRMARTIQKTMKVDSSERYVARDLASRDFEAIDCVRSTFEPGSPKPNQLVSQIEAMTANTRERAMHYMRYNSALNGMSFDMAATPTCK